MLAKDAKCPKCGEGFRDVAPDYDLSGQSPMTLVPLASSETFGHCLNGHRMVTRWERGLDVKVRNMEDPDRCLIEDWCVLIRNHDGQCDRVTR